MFLLKNYFLKKKKFENVKKISITKPKYYISKFKNKIFF